MKRIALLVPHTDTVLETDLQRFLPDDVIIHTARIWLDEVSEEAEKKMVDVKLPLGIEKLKDITNFNLAIFGCTSASAIYGREGLVKIEKSLSKEFNCPAISALGAVLNNLKELNSSKVAMLGPYSKPVLKVMEKTLKDFNVIVNYSIGLGITDDIECGFVKPYRILRLAKENKKEIIENSNTLFLSCTNFRSNEIKEKLEEKIGIPTLTSNSSIIKWILNHLTFEREN